MILGLRTSWNLFINFISHDHFRRFVNLSLFRILNSFFYFPTDAETTPPETLPTVWHPYENLETLYNTHTVNKIPFQCVKISHTFSDRYPISSYKDPLLKSAQKCGFTTFWYIRVVLITCGSSCVVLTCRFVFITNPHSRCLVGNYVSRFMRIVWLCMSCITMVFHGPTNCNVIASGQPRMLGHVLCLEISNLPNVTRNLELFSNIP